MIHAYDLALSRAKRTKKISSTIDICAAYCDELNKMGIRLTDEAMSFAANVEPGLFALNESFFKAQRKVAKNDRK